MVRFKDLCEKVRSGKVLVHDKLEFTENDKTNYAKLLKGMGWERWHMDEAELLERTARTIEGINKGIRDENVREKLQVGDMRNLRISNTMSYTDRYKFNVPGEVDVTVICNINGNRGNYYIFSKENNFCAPVHSSTSIKEVGKYIDSLVA